MDSRTTPASSAGIALPIPASAFQKGISFTAWRAGHYTRPETEVSLQNLLATGANWIAVIVTGYQDNHGSTTIDRTSRRTSTDADLAHVIRLTHERGVKVMLKPHLNLSNDLWRGQIGTTFTTESQWEAWFQAYEGFITHYAELAQQNGVELFSIGTELAGVTHRESDWRRIVGAVRQRFNGHLTYASHDRLDFPKVTWWDALDYIGVDVYIPLTTKTDPTVDELKRAWIEGGYGAQLEDVSRRFNKPVIFTEIGYRSVNGANKSPWDWRTKGKIDLQEQADLYQAALEVFWGNPWLAGMFWWEWLAYPQKGGATDDGYTPYNKPAQEVLRRFYLGQR